MPTAQTPRGLVYTPSRSTVTWGELHDELAAVAEGELSLQAIDSILRLTADDGELLSVTVHCRLAAGPAQLVTGHCLGDAPKRQRRLSALCQVVVSDVCIDLDPEYGLVAEDFSPAPGQAKPDTAASRQCPLDSC